VIRSAGRRLRGKPTRFQLASLLDLLLIVVFAQFLEMRQRASDEEIQHRSEVASLREEVDRQAAETRQAARIGEETVALLDRAMQVVRQQLTEPRPGEPPTLQRRVEGLREQLAAADSAEVLRFLVGYDELLKRAEVWDLHADSSGLIELSVGGQSRSFRLEAARQAGRADEFAEGLYRIFKQLPQPKGLVVVLVSYGLQTTAGTYQAIIDGMPAAVQRLRQDSPNVRFEYTVLGPVDASPGPPATTPPSDTPQDETQNDEAPSESSRNRSP
jgi:hypothetical protein